MVVKRARRPEARPDEILDAALTVFARQGFASARVEDIAKEAGLSKGAVYLYFDSKESMLKALVRRLADRVIGAAEALVEAQADVDAEKTLRSLLTFIIGQIADPKLAAAPRVVITEAPRFPEIAALYRDAVLTRVRKILTKICERGAAQGVFRAVEPDVLLRTCGGPVVAHLMLTTVFNMPAAKPDEVGNCIADMVLNGLKKRQGQST